MAKSTRVHSSSWIMSDTEMSDDDQPPALEDAEIDDVSSGASVVSDSSDSVSINTDSEEEGSEEDYEDDDDAEETARDALAWAAYVFGADSLALSEWRKQFRDFDISV